jgi:hypothetical protein
MQYVRFALSIFALTTALACSRSGETAAPQAAPAPTAPAPAPAPPPTPPPTPTPEAPAPAAAPEPELPPKLVACNRKCSTDANHRQMEGFVRCEKAKKGPDCKPAVLAANDTERAACRKACEAKLAR